ncbi:MAG: aminopeptidase [Ruminococcaceae bacterium]|nr:aminopeptidase [Oscillospiraceae bacterium]
MSENTNIATELETKLGYKKTNFYEKSDEAAIKAAYDYAPGYMKYLDDAKTEREAVTVSIAMAEKEGYIPYTFGMELKVGGKYYYNNRGRNLYLFRVGSEPINNGIRIAAAHIDNPRIDVKQSPLYEDGGMAFFKTRYYGGIRKYQWVTIPLALHGVVVKADGEVVNVVIGEAPSDPVIYINDLLPHLAQDQSAKPLGKAIPAENLNLLLGTRPYPGLEGGNAIRLNILSMLNEKYGITEEDFLSADLSAVPADKARDVGLDRSLIGAYGHDDRVCAYPSMTALFGTDDSTHTSMVILADKEEIGSDGNTGMQCELMTDLIEEITRALGGNFATVKANSKCISSDVTACFDPNFAEVFDRRNVSMLNCGVAMSKYTGHGGKVGTNDAPAEYVAWIRKIMAEAGVIWQAGDMGKTDVGGGGTVAKFIAKHNIETVDLGVPVIAMHAPYEVISKADLYTAHLAFEAFFRA